MNTANLETNTQTIDRLRREVAELARSRDILMRESAERIRECDRLRRELISHREKAQGNYWAWQGDGGDHVESLVCPVLIHPRDLGEILKQREKLEEDLKGWKAGADAEAKAHDTELASRKLWQQRAHELAEGLKFIRAKVDHISRASSAEGSRTSVAFVLHLIDELLGWKEPK